MKSLPELERKLAAIVRQHGHSRAGWFLGEAAAEAIGVQPGHGPRRNAARALQAGCSVTADLGYTGQLSQEPGRSISIDPTDLI